MILENLDKIKQSLPENVKLVAVSKTKPVSDIMEAYEAGQRIFGENKVQEMTQKWEKMPKDIEWHMIGHIQTNKVKYMAPFVSLIHSVDSIKLLKEINKQAKKHNRVIPCLLQVFIAEEDSKFGLDESKLEALLQVVNQDKERFKHIKLVGLMGMATFTDDKAQVKREFLHLKSLFDTIKRRNSEFKIISMGMSRDYDIAVSCGSTMVRLGSTIFGSRNYS